MPYLCITDMDKKVNTKATKSQLILCFDETIAHE